MKGESRNDSVRAMISHRMCCGSFGAGPKNVCVRKCVCVCSVAKLLLKRRLEMCSRRN